MGDYERLSYDTALRSLDKQEALLDELRARTGTLLTASSLAASFLGANAFKHPHPGWAPVVALLAFAVSIAASVFILVPRRDRFVFSLSGQVSTKVSTGFATITQRSTVDSRTTSIDSGVRTTTRSRHSSGRIGWPPSRSYSKSWV